MTAPIVKSADTLQSFERKKGSSRTDTGAVLLPRDDSQISRSIAHVSHKLNTAEHKYPTHDRD
jgi:RNase H-like domain found in reverse transcriptase